MNDYENLLIFVEQNDLQRKPFNEVINLYNKELKDCYDDMQADEYLASIESHEVCNIWY